LGSVNYGKLKEGADLLVCKGHDWWSYDFMIARTAEGRAFRILTILDEYTSECLAILVDRKISSQDVMD